MFGKILVALNTEESYAPIFDSALELAVATGAELHLISVIDRDTQATLPLMSYPGVTGYPLTVSESIWTEYQENYKNLKARGESILSELAKEANVAGVHAEFLQQVGGEPGKVICNRAKTIQADLIVVGSHGRRGIDELLVGSVSSYVMHRAPCSVMVIHDKLARENDKNADEIPVSLHA